MRYTNGQPLPLPFLTTRHGVDVIFRKCAIVRLVEPSKFVCAWSSAVYCSVPCSCICGVTTPTSRSVYHDHLPTKMELSSSPSGRGSQRWWSSSSSHLLYSSSTSSSCARSLSAIAQYTPPTPTWLNCRVNNNNNNNNNNNMTFVMR